MVVMKEPTVDLIQYDDYIRYILKSGLVLDEDMDCILAHFNADSDNFTERKLSFTQKLLSSISITSTIFIIQRKYSMFYLPVAASPLLLVCIQELCQLFYRNNQKYNLEALIKALRDILKINLMICEYYKLRNSVNSAINIINPYTRAMKQLIQMTFQEEVNLLYAFRGFIWQFGEYMHSLRIDYEYLENIDFEQFTKNNIDSINDCVIFLQRLCDIYVLVVSSTLTCLAVTLCPNLSTVNKIYIDETLDTIIPQMKRISISCYNKIDKKFDNVKYHHLKKTQILKQLKPPVLNTSSKLYSSTCKVVECSSDILEKSQIMLKMLKKHNLQTFEEKIELSACIAELRSQVYDFYQSLNVLHKLYEININPMRPPYELKAETSSTSSKESISVEYIVDNANLNPSEPSDDEEYELYIGDNETPSENTIHSFQEDESCHFASLVSQELKQKLKNHAQFVAARKKRGIIDEEPESGEVPEITNKNPIDIEDQEVLRNRCIFPFDANLPTLPLPIGIPKPLPNCEPFNAHPLIPPPPPLPPVNLGLFGDSVGSPYAVNDFLHSLKTATKHLKSEEEIFRTSDVDDE